MIFVLVFLFSSSVLAVQDVISVELKKTLKEHDYPEQVYKAEKMIQKEMKKRGTCLTAFEAKIGRKPDGHLDKFTFLQWQRHKKFNKEAAYRQRNPFVEYEWGGDRNIYYPLRTSPEDDQMILPLSSPMNKVLIAWNKKIFPKKKPSSWKVIFGYGDSSKLHLKKLLPFLEGSDGYYGVILYTPPGRVMHFRLVQLGFNSWDFPKELPFSVSYKELAQRGLIPERIWHKYQDDNCQAIVRQGNNIKFIY